MSNDASSCLHKRLISTDRVEGKQVVGLDGVSLGKITRLDIERASGKVTSAFVLRPGHFGLGAAEHEIPWQALRFDISIEAFRTDLNVCDPIRHVIHSDRIEGMKVCNPDGVSIGKVTRMLIDKVTGHVESAVVVRHKLLGLGSKEYRVTWNELDFDTHLSAFRVCDCRVLQPLAVEDLDQASPGNGSAPPRQGREERTST
jgi:sporulation protein YlmC with PRC-barrel domain